MRTENRKARDILYRYTLVPHQGDGWNCGVHTLYNGWLFRTDTENYLRVLRNQRLRFVHEERTSAEFGLNRRKEFLQLLEQISARDLPSEDYFAAVQAIVFSYKVRQAPQTPSDLVQQYVPFNLYPFRTWARREFVERPEVFPCLLHLE